MSSSEILLTADLHIHKWREFAQLKGGVNDRLLDGVSVLTDIDRYAMRHGIDDVIIAGDLFQKRAVLDVETFNLVFDTIKRTDRRWWLLDGNHDQATKDGRIHSLEPFNALSNVNVVGRSSHTIGYTRFDFFPYRDDEKSVMEELRKANRSSKALPVAIMHHGFKGARVGSALEYEVKEPLDPQAVLNFGYDFVFSGHYHTRQHLADNLMYIGAPCEHTRHDRSNRKRGFLLFNVDTKKVTVVPLKKPRFVTVYPHGEHKNYPEELVKGNFVDLVLEEEDPATVDVVKHNARGVNVEIEPRVKLKKHKQRLDIDPSTDPRKVVELYVQWALDQERTKLDPELLKRVGLDLIREAQGG